MTHHLKLYGFPLSQPVRSVLMLCKTAGIEYDFVLIDALKEEHKTAEYRAICPTGLVPLIDDNGFRLAESGAILQYLAESRGLSNFYPTDLQAKARVNFWMHWHHTNSRKGTLGVLLPHVFPPQKNVEEIVEKGIHDFTKVVEFVENHLKNNGSQFLAGDHVTLADILIIPEFDQLQAEGFNLFDYTNYPEVVGWMKRVAAAIPSYQEVFAPVAHVAAHTTSHNHHK